MPSCAHMSELARKAIAAPQFHLCQTEEQTLLLMPSSKNYHLHAANITATFSIGNVSLALAYIIKHHREKRHEIEDQGGVHGFRGGPGKSVKTLNGFLSEAAHNKSGDKAAPPLGAIALNNHGISGGRKEQKAAQRSERNMASNV